MKSQRREEEQKRDKLVDDARKCVSRATSYKDKVNIFNNFRPHKTYILTAQKGE